MTFEEKIIELGNFFKNNKIEYLGENEVDNGEKKFIFTFNYKISNDSIVIYEEVKLIVDENFQGIFIIALEELSEKIKNRISMSYDILCIVNESNRSSSFSKAHFENEHGFIYILRVAKENEYKTEDDEIDDDKIFFYLYHVLCHKKIIQIKKDELLNSFKELTIKAANDFYKYCIKKEIEIKMADNEESEDMICFLLNDEKHLFNGQDDFQCYVEFSKQHHSVTLYTNIEMEKTFFERNRVEINRIVSGINGLGNSESYSTAERDPIVFIAIELYGKIINDAQEVLKRILILSMRKDNFIESCSELE